MTDSLLDALITVGILVILGMWVPCVHHCHRFLRNISRKNLPVIAVAVVLLALHGVAFGQLTAVSHITTVAGTGNAGYSGDGGAATSAALNNPAGIVLDGAGNLYIVDQKNSVIRLLT